MVSSLLLAGGLAMAQPRPEGPAPEEPAPEEPAPEEPAPEEPAPEEPAPEEPAPEEPGEPEADPPTQRTAKWGGIAIPLLNYNSTDGLSLGLGGEFFQRPPSGDFGYLRKITWQVLFSIDLAYQSHQVIYETRTGRQDLLAMVGFGSWQDLVYAGNGGGDVVMDWGDAEVGNWAVSPIFLFGASQHAWLGAFYAQGFYRYSNVEPQEGSLLDERAPTGAFGGHYTDVTVGYFVEQVDQWPLPTSGWRGDLSLSGGGAVVKDKVGFLPNLGVNGAFMGWWPALGPRLVVGGRLLVAKRAGDRPFFEGEFVGGRRRDEVGFEKALTGYGRTRTRGDGAVAALLEVRPFLGRTHHRFWDLSAYVSLFAEEGWLFDGFDPGPHLPTLGVGGVVVWQGATMLRPFVAWGWRADEPGGVRHAVPQFGLAMQDPL